MSDEDEKAECPAQKSPRSPGVYEVGYGKPPKGAQFKPKQSGNPSGRPKKPRPAPSHADEQTPGGQVQKILNYGAPAKVDGDYIHLDALSESTLAMRMASRGGKLSAALLIVGLYRDNGALRPPGLLTGVLVVERILTLEQWQKRLAEHEEEKPVRASRRRQDPLPGIAPGALKAAQRSDLAKRRGRPPKAAQVPNDQLSNWDLIRKILDQKMPAKFAGKERLFDALDEAVLTLRKAARGGSVKAWRELQKLGLDLERGAVGQATGVLVVARIKSLEEWVKDVEGYRVPLDPLEGLPGVTPEMIEALNVRAEGGDGEDDCPELCV